MKTKHIIKTMKGLDLPLKVQALYDGSYRITVLDQDIYTAFNKEDVNEILMQQCKPFIEAALDFDGLTDDQIVLIAEKGIEAAFSGYEVKEVKTPWRLKRAALHLDPYKTEWDHGINVAVAQFDLSLLLTCSPPNNENWTYINERFEDFLEDLFYCSTIPEQYAVLSYKNKSLYLYDKEAKEVTYKGIDYSVQKAPDPSVVKWIEGRILFHLIKIEKYLEVHEVILMTPLYPLWEKRSVHLINTLLPLTYMEKQIIERGDRGEARDHLQQEYRFIHKRLQQHKKDLYEKAMAIIAQKFSDDVKALNDYIDNI